MSAVAITGAAGAIGAAVAELFARQGRHVFLLDSDGAGLEKIAARIAQNRDKGTALLCDVSASSQVAAAFERIQASGEKLAGLVNTAGILSQRAHFLDLCEQDWERVIAVNLKGVFLCSQAAARIMAKQRQGAIVNLGSVSSRRAHREQAAYDAAKGGVEALTRAMALDLAPYGIRVNAVLPAAITTETMVAHSSEEFAHQQRLVPLGRYGRPAEVAQACEFLISRADFITGQCIVVDGGLEGQLRPLELEYLESTRFREEAPEA